MIGSIIGETESQIKGVNSEIREVYDSYYKDLKGIVKRGLFAVLDDKAYSVILLLWVIGALVLISLWVLKTMEEPVGYLVVGLNSTFIFLIGLKLIPYIHTIRDGKEKTETDKAESSHKTGNSKQDGSTL